LFKTLPLPLSLCALGKKLQTDGTSPPTSVGGIAVGKKTNEGLRFGLGERKRGIRAAKGCCGKEGPSKEKGLAPAKKKKKKASETTPELVSGLKLHQATPT